MGYPADVKKLLRPEYLGLFLQMHLAIPAYSWHSHGIVPQVLPASFPSRTRGGLPGPGCLGFLRLRPLAKKPRSWAGNFAGFHGRVSCEVFLRPRPPCALPSSERNVKWEIERGEPC